jgi:hypothetical protein
MMEAARISETSVNLHQTKRRSIPEDFILAAVRTWNLKQMNPVHVTHHLPLMHGILSQQIIPSYPFFTTRCFISCHRHPCCIWLPVRPLNLTYILLSLLLISTNLIHRQSWYFKCQISHQFFFSFLRPFQIIHPSRRPCATFRNKLVFYSDRPLVPPHPKLEDYPFSVVCESYPPY